MELSLKQINDRIETVRMALRVARSDKSNPSVIIKSIEQDEEQIKFLQDRIECSRRRLERAPEDVARYKAELAGLTEKQRLLDKSTQVKAFKKIAASVNDLERSVAGLGYTPEQMALLAEKLGVDTLSLKGVTQEDAEAEAMDKIGENIEEMLNEDN